MTLGHVEGAIDLARRFSVTDAEIAAILFRFAIVWDPVTGELTDCAAGNI
jgi:hypothetical protein